MLLHTRRCSARHYFVLKLRNQCHVHAALGLEEHHETDAEEDDDEESEGEHDEEDGDRYHHHPRGLDVDDQREDNGEV